MRLERRAWTRREAYVGFHEGSFGGSSADGEGTRATGTSGGGARVDCVRFDPSRRFSKKICRMAEEFVPGSLAGVTILDRAGHTFEGCVMPSAPSFAAAIAGIEVGPPHAGTCAAAVYRGTPVSSTDAAADERFDPVWRRLNADHGVRCIQSRPVTSADGRALGKLLHRLHGRGARAVARGHRGGLRTARRLRPGAPSHGGAQPPDCRRDAAPAEEPVRVGAVDRRADVAKRAGFRGIHEGLRGSGAGAGRRARSPVAG